MQPNAMQNMTMSTPGMQNMQQGNFQMIALPVGAAPPPGAIPAGPPSGQLPTNYQSMHEGYSGPLSTSAPQQPFQPMGEIFPQGHADSRTAGKSFRIVNPRTGEEVQGPKQDSHTKRFPIMDPGTGMEVLPDVEKENLDRASLA